jgi:hypothetical protein
MISLEEVNELNEVSMTYSYVAKKIGTFLKACQLKVTITCKKSYETALRESPRTVSTERGSPLPCMAVNLS